MNPSSVHTQTDELSFWQYLLDVPLSYTDYIRSITLLSAFIFLLCRPKRTGRAWFEFDMIACSTAAIGLLFFPKISVEFQLKKSTELDVLHVSMVKVFGALYAGVAVSSILTRKSNDSVVLQSHFITRILSCIIMVVMTLTNHFAVDSVYNIQHLTFSLLLFAGHLICSIIYMHQYEPSVKFISTAWMSQLLNFFLLLDSIHSTVMAVLHFTNFSAFAKQFTFEGVKLNTLHLALSNVMSGIVLGFAFQSILALFYSSAADKRAVLWARLVTMSLSQFYAFIPALLQYSIHTPQEIMQKQMVPVVVMVVYLLVIYLTRKQK